MLTRARGTLLIGLLVLSAFSSLGCSGNSGASDMSAVNGLDGGRADAGSSPGLPDLAGTVDMFGALQPPPITRSQTEAELAPQRKACAFKAGAWAAETLGTDFPVGSDIPINHVMIIMQENRSFDHYYGRLVAQGYYKAGDFTPGGSGFSHSDELDDPPAGWSNTDSNGTVVVPHPDDEYCFGENHGWNDMHDDWDNGKNDHFVTNNDPDGQRALFYEDDTVIPFYYALASTFSVGDRYFASVMSSTWPNRFFMMAATSFGIGDNSFCTLDTRAHPAPQIFLNLQAAFRTWKDYTDGPHQEIFFPGFGSSPATGTHYADAKCDLMQDIQNGTLPDVSYIMGDEVTETGDEGPSDLPGIGGQWVEAIIRNLFASPMWKDTAVFIMYDENGGMADHVPPADACPPDDYMPHDSNGNPFVGDFTKTGFRVPFTVVSPYAKSHFASHTIYDHSSVVRFIEARFGLPALTGRDANATPPMEMFDFANPPFMTPPDIKAHTTVPDAVLAKCNQSYSPTECGE